MEAIRRFIVSIGIFVNRVFIRIIKLSSLIVSFSLMLISLVFIFMFFADYKYANSFFSHYAIQQAYQNGLDDFVKLCSFFGQQKILSVLILVLLLGGLFSLKFFLRKNWTKNLNMHRLLTNSAYLLTNFLISSIIVVIIFSSVIITTVVGYMDKAIKENTSLNTLPFSERANYVRDTVRDNTILGRAALAKAIYDFENNPNYLEKYSPEERLAFCLEINRLIDLQGGPKTAEEHYFRNFLNDAPPSLNDMLNSIKTGSLQNWKLLSPEQSAFHMYGEKGEYNLKFVSENGFYEAVYNIEGILLTEKNDAVNMGTYNYADPISEPQKHSIYDVLPYFEWGNVSTSDIQPEDALIDTNRFYQNPDAVSRYEKIKAEIEGFSQ